jgi:Ras family protein T1
LCYVLGATGSGKTSLLRRFVNKPVAGGEDGLGEYEPTTKVLSVVNSVEMEGAEKYLVVGNRSSQLAAFLISLPETRCVSVR